MANIYKTLLNKLNDDNPAVLLTYLVLDNNRSGSVIEKRLLTVEDIEKGNLTVESAIYDKISFSLDTGKLQIINLEQNKNLIVEPFFPKPRLVIFGGGHIAKPLSEYASKVGFSITLIDDRPSFANTARFPEVQKVICESFEKSFDSVTLKKSDYVVIVTRGHRHDGLVLREALKHELSYLGMIGSKRRVAGMREELLNEGFTKERLDLLNAPIGLDIGAITPDEIAISIISQLISYKNKGIVTKSGKNFTFPEFDLEVAEKLSEGLSLPKALLTILSSKGSVPRKAGAKMLIYPDGRTVGSIGGGCSEAAVVSKARGIISDKGCSIEHVDMTGDVAEAEGMVCGGVMEVLIEAL